MSQLVRLAKLRWRIERDYQELKGEFGLAHFEGRRWRGFHHHGSFCIAAYAFLAAERAQLSPLRLCPSSAPLGYPWFHSAGAVSIPTLRRFRSRALLLQLPCTWCGHVARAG